MKAPVDRWWDEIRALMWEDLGIVRSTKGMTHALARLEEIRAEIADFSAGEVPTAKYLEVRNLADVAWLTVRCALARRESRGCHFTEDYPLTDAVGKDTLLAGKGYGE